MFSRVFPIRETVGPRSSHLHTIRPGAHLGQSPPWRQIAEESGQFGSFASEIYVDHNYVFFCMCVFVIVFVYFTIIYSDKLLGAPKKSGGTSVAWCFRSGMSQFLGSRHGFGNLLDVRQLALGSWLHLGHRWHRGTSSPQKWSDMVKWNNNMCQVIFQYELFLLSPYDHINSAKNGVCVCVWYASIAWYLYISWWYLVTSTSTSKYLHHPLKPAPHINLLPQSHIPIMHDCQIHQDVAKAPLLPRCSPAVPTAPAAGLSAAAAENPWIWRCGAVPPPGAPRRTPGLNSRGVSKDFRGS